MFILLSLVQMPYGNFGLILQIRQLPDSLNIRNN